MNYFSAFHGLKKGEPSKIGESDYKSYAYINRIIRPGYDLKQNDEVKYHS